MKHMKSAAIVLALAIPSIANAATDGQPGATSTGSFDVTLTVSPPGGTPMVQVSELDDITLPTINAADAATGDPSFTSGPDGYFCVSGQNLNPWPTVTFSQTETAPAGSSAEGQYVLVGPGGQFIPVELKINAEVLPRNGATPHPLYFGACTGTGASATAYAENTTPGFSTPVEKPRITLRRLGYSGPALTAGSYTGTITVTVQAN